MATHHIEHADCLRLMINVQLQRGLISPQLAEQALIHVNALAAAAQLGQQLGALGLAATAQSAAVAETLQFSPIVPTSNWGRHQQWSLDGKPIEREKLSKTERDAKKAAESIGHKWGGSNSRSAA